MTARKSLSLASASTQKTYKSFSGLSRRLTKGERHVSAVAGRVPMPVAKNQTAKAPMTIAKAWMRRAINDLLIRQRTRNGHVPQRGIQSKDTHGSDNMQ